MYRILFFTCLTLSFFFYNRGYAQEAHNPFLKPNGYYQAGKLDSAVIGYLHIKDSLKNIGQDSSFPYFYAVSKIIDIKSLQGLYNQAVPLINEVEENLNKNGSDSSQVTFNMATGQLYLYGPSDLEKALYYFEKAYISNEKLEVNPNSITIGLLLGATLRNMAQYDSALRYMHEALDLSLKAYGPLDFHVGSAYGQIGQVYQFQGKMEKSLYYFKEMMNIMIREVNPDYLADKEYTEADSLKQFFQDVLEIEKRDKVFDKFHPADLSVVPNIAVIMLDLGILNLAKEISIAAEKSFRQNGVIELAAQTKINTAAVYAKSFQKRHALTIFESILEDLNQNNFTQNSTHAMVFHNMAIIHGELGDYEKQLEYNQKALAIRERIYLTENKELADTYQNIASALVSLNKPKEALNFLDLATKNGYHVESEVLLQRGNAQELLGKLDSAESSYRRAMEAAPINSHYSKYANAMGHLKIEMKQLDSAAYYYDQALQHNQLLPEMPDLDKVAITDIGIMNEYLFLQTLENKANALNLLYLQTGNSEFLSKSVEAYNITWELISSMHTSFIQEVDNLSFAAKVSYILASGVEANLTLAQETGDDFYLFNALKLADLSKSPILLENRALQRLALQNKGSLFTEAYELKSRIKALEASIYSLELVSAQAQTSEITSKKGKLQALRDEYSEMLALLRTERPQSYKNTDDEINRFPLDEFRNYLDDNNASAIHFFEGNKIVYRFIVSSDDITLERLDSDLTDLQKKFSSIREFLADPSSLTQETYSQFLDDSHWLYDQLFNQKETDIHSDQLIIMADGFMAGFPFELLITAKPSGSSKDFKNLPYLLLDKSIQYASSISTLIEGTKADYIQTESQYTGWAPFASNAPLVNTLSAPNRDAANIALPATSQEIAALSGLFEGFDFLDSAATEEQFKKNAQKGSILHLATHGLVNNVEPLQSQLLFNTEATDSLEDGRLHIFELYGASLNTDITVLTACNSGVGKYAPGEGSLSLARAFEYAGSKSVVMSLWLANDQSTSEIIGEFYQNLANNQGKGEALRNAKLRYLEEADNLASHPFYWSHLILSGDSSPLDTNDRSNTLLWILGIVTICFVIIRLRPRASKS